MIWIIGISFLLLAISIFSKSKVDNIPPHKPEPKNTEIKKSVRTFNIAGIDYQNIKDSERGHFKGFAVPNPHPKDKYCIEVRSFNNRLLGYLPKGNTKIFNNIIESHSGKLYAWGYISNDIYFRGTEVNIPLGFNNVEINNIISIFKLQDEIDFISKNAINDTSKAFQSMENFKLISNLLKTLPKVPINNYFPATIIPSLSRRLEKEKDWTNLKKLEDHLFLINNLSDKYKITTLKRIEKAKQYL